MKVELEFPRPVEAKVQLSPQKPANYSSASIEPKFFSKTARSPVMLVVVKGVGDETIGSYALSISGVTGKLFLTSLVEVQCSYDESAGATKDATDPEEQEASS